MDLSESESSVVNDKVLSFDALVFDDELEEDDVSVGSEGSSCTLSSRWTAVGVFDGFPFGMFALSQAMNSSISALITAESMFEEYSAAKH